MITFITYTLIYTTPGRRYNNIWAYYYRCCFPSCAVWVRRWAYGTCTPDRLTRTTPWRPVSSWACCSFRPCRRHRRRRCAAWSCCARKWATTEPTTDSCPATAGWPAAGDGDAAAAADGTSRPCPSLGRRALRKLWAFRSYIYSDYNEQ